MAQSALVPTPQTLVPEGAHFPETQERLLHPADIVQASPSHFSAQEPPQSSPVSSPSRLPSVHDAAAHRLAVQLADKHITEEEQAWPNPHLGAPARPQETATGAASTGLGVTAESASEAGLTEAEGEEHAPATKRQAPREANSERIEIDYGQPASNQVLSSPSKPTKWANLSDAQQARSERTAQGRSFATLRMTKLSAPPTTQASGKAASKSGCIAHRSSKRQSRERARGTARPVKRRAERTIVREHARTPPRGCPVRARALARPVGVEPTTPGFEGRCSIQLS